MVGRDCKAAPLLLEGRPVAGELEGAASWGRSQAATPPLLPPWSPCPPGGVSARSSETGGGGDLGVPSFCEMAGRVVAIGVCLALHLGNAPGNARVENHHRFPLPEPLLFLPGAPGAESDARPSRDLELASL